ncbi:DUF3168 domain-containing protein [Bordetella bronchiseptica]|uniref:tail completion protein gp17 n=1 Tax=Bordetella bronchiseptica TaxID=518 RepID=UPI0004616979|nr:DUF3168 domain-containing protein [Bordetella bronchiseptica]KDD10108.1 PF11367 family protein [Bordetella bronchiseptica MBORD707]
MIEGDFYLRIKDLAGGRVYPGVAPSGTDAPYLTFQLISGNRDWVLAGASGARRATIQVNAWGRKPAEAAELIEQVFALIEPDASDFSCVGAQDLSTIDDEETTALHGAAMEFFLIR